MQRSTVGMMELKDVAGSGRGILWSTIPDFSWKD